MESQGTEPQGVRKRPRRRSRSWRIAFVTAASLLAGLILAVAVVTAPVMPARTNILVAGVLLAFALGWAMLAGLSVRFTDQPQRWAAVPAAFMALAGGVALSGSTLAQTVFTWIWPPLLLGLAGLMWLRARRELPSRQLPSRLSRWLLYPVIAVLGLASIGGGISAVQQAVRLQPQRMPGQLVDIGSHRPHLHCVGSGSPTVVLEPGAGATSETLRWIAPDVARDTRVCTYDRAGRGFSDDANGPQDGAHIAADLHTLLTRAHVPGPYVLAGHSFGGLYILSFAARFPDEVAGMVLLDSTSPKSTPAGDAGPDPDSVVSRLAVLMPAVGRLGPGRDSGSSLQETFEGAASVHHASLTTNLDEKPLIVVTADTDHGADWLPAQQHLTTLSTNSLHRTAHAIHQSLVDDEADSAAAAQAIRDVVQAVRTSRPLAAQ